MKIIINEDEFTKNELDSWKRKRVGKVLKNLKVTLPIVKDTDELCDRLTLIKLKMSYEEITSSMMLKLIIGQVGMLPFYREINAELPLLLFSLMALQQKNLI